MGDSLIAFRIPVRIDIIVILEIFSTSDELLPQFQSMLNPIPKDIDWPIVRSAFLAVHDMHCNVQLRLILIILDYFYDLSLGNVSILYA